MTHETCKGRETEALGVLAMARDDAKTHGFGYVRVLPYGKVERLDPRTVQVHEDAPVDGGDGLGMYYDR